MSAITVGAGDSVSRLIQLIAGRNGIRLNWTSRGADDLQMLCLGYSNKDLLTQCLWNGMKELMAMPELNELPEAVQAKIFAIVLQAQANFELKVLDRNTARERATPPPQGVPA